MKKHISIRIETKILEEARSLEVNMTEVFKEALLKKIKSLSRPKAAPAEVSGDAYIQCIYDRYPRKVGKKKGFELAKKIPLNRWADFERAVDNYSSYVSNNVTEEKYIKHFSTFVASWEDWVDVKTFWDNLELK